MIPSVLLAAYFQPGLLWWSHNFIAFQISFEFLNFETSSSSKSVSLYKLWEMFYKEILEQTGPESAVLEHLQAIILKRFSLCANHGVALVDSMYVPVCPKISWIRHCRVLKMSLELRDSFAFVFVFYSSA